jgi:hypothetical protein
MQGLPAARARILLHCAAPPSTLLGCLAFLLCTIGGRMGGSWREWRRGVGRANGRVHQVKLNRAESRAMRGARKNVGAKVWYPSTVLFLVVGRGLPRAGA